MTNYSASNSAHPPINNYASYLLQIISGLEKPSLAMFWISTPMFFKDVNCSSPSWPTTKNFQKKFSSETKKILSCSSNSSSANPTPSSICQLSEKSSNYSGISSSSLPSPSMLCTKISNSGSSVFQLHLTLAWTNFINTVHKKAMK